MTRGYDAAGRWTSVLDWNTNTTTFGYDPNSNLTTATFPTASGVVDTFTFNGADQLTAIASMKGASTLFAATYTRDAANQLTSDSSAASGTGSYKYTPLNQVCYAGSGNTTACSSPPTGSIPYTYDAADNPTRKGAIQQAFNSADELCWTASTSSACATPPTGATTYQYDNRGDRTGVTPSGGQAQTLTFDQAGRLTKYTAATSYGYNADGLRMCKVTGSTTQPCQAPGNTQYVWDVGGSMPVLVKDGSISYVTGPGGLPLEQISGTATYWFHHDQIGSTRLITDATGASQATYTFDPYGGLASSSGNVTNPFRFAGQYNDAETGLYYLQARYYDPTVGQFISIDPAAATSRQRYGYTSGNPLNGTDPRGLCWPDWACHAVSVVGGAFNNLGTAVHAYDVAHVSDLEAFANVTSTISVYSGLIGRGCALASLMTGVADPLAWLPDACAAVFTGISLGTGLLTVAADLAACNGGSAQGCSNAPWAALGFGLQLVGAGAAPAVGATWGPAAQWACGAGFGVGGALLRTIHKALSSGGQTTVGS